MGNGIPYSVVVLSRTCLSLRDAARPIYDTWVVSVGLVISTNPEKTGNEDASMSVLLDGGVIMTATSIFSPALRVKEVALSSTAADTLESGTGPLAVNIVP